jgi:hypothetical protein
VANPETPIMQRIRLEIGARHDTRIFRNLVGGFKMADGTFRNVGLCTGSPDLIGWRSVEITPEMVGRRVAVFVGIEVKTETGRLTAEQAAFIVALKNAGGLADVARSAEEAHRIVDAL